MIWPNFITGEPFGIGRVATLWPIGTARRTLDAFALELGAGRQRDDRGDDIVLRMQPYEAARGRSGAAADAVPRRVKRR